MLLILLFALCQTEPIDNPIEHFLGYFKQYDVEVQELYVLRVDLNSDGSEEVLLSHQGAHVDNGGYAWIVYAREGEGYKHLEKAIPKFFPDCCHFIGELPGTDEPGLFIYRHVSASETFIHRVTLADDGDEDYEFVRSVMTHNPEDMEFLHQYFSDAEDLVEVFRVENYEVVGPMEFSEIISPWRQRRSREAESEEEREQERTSPDTEVSSAVDEIDAEPVADAADKIGTGANERRK